MRGERGNAEVIGFEEKGEKLGDSMLRLDILDNELTFTIL